MLQPRARTGRRRLHLSALNGKAHNDSLIQGDSDSPEAFNDSCEAQPIKSSLDDFGCRQNLCLPGLGLASHSNG